MILNECISLQRGTFLGFAVAALGLSRAMAMVVRPATQEVVVDDTNRFRQCVNAYADKLDALEPELGKSIRAHPGKVKKTSKRTMVIGAGSGNTGTSSLTTALTRLGLKVAHDMWTPIPRNEYCPYYFSLRKTLWNETSTCLPFFRQFDFTSVPKKLDAICDTPYTEMFIDLFLSFPKARFILTDRPKDDWARDRMQFDGGKTALPLQEPCKKAITPEIPHDKFAALFALNNEFVRCMVPPKRLFEMNVFTDNTSDLMPRLAKFLHRKLPKNKTFLAYPKERINGFAGRYRYRSCFSKTMLAQLGRKVRTEVWD